MSASRLNFLGTNTFPCYATANSGVNSSIFVNNTMYKNLAPPLSDVLSRDNKANGSIIELQSLGFSKGSKITQNDNNNLNFNNAVVNGIVINDNDIQNGTDPVNKNYIDLSLKSIKMCLQIMTQTNNFNYVSRDPVTDENCIIRFNAIDSTISYIPLSVPS